MAFSGLHLNATNGCRLLGNGLYANDAWNDNIHVGITIVSGLTPAGHALLRIRYDSHGGGRKSSYFHVDELARNVPKYLDGRSDFNKYIAENGKTVHGTIWMPRVDGAPAKLKQVLEIYATG